MPERMRLYTPIFQGVNRLHLVIVGATLAAIPIAAYGLYWPRIVEVLLYVAAVVVLISLLVIGARSGREYRDRTFLVIVLMFCNALFWAFFEQTGTSLTSFTDRNVIRSVAGFEIQTGSFQSVNPAFIILFGPVFARLWSYLGFRGLNPSIPMKFALGLLQMSLGFMCLVWGAAGADANAQTHMGWLILSYLFQTTGELCESPVGLSAVTKLAPPQYTGTYMGAWFLSWAFANHLAAQIAKLTDVGWGTEGVVISAAEQLASYVTVFRQIAIAAFAAGIILALASRFLNKLAHGVK